MYFSTFYKARTWLNFNYIHMLRKYILFQNAWYFENIFLLRVLVKYFRILKVDIFFIFRIFLYFLFKQNVYINESIKKFIAHLLNQNSFYQLIFHNFPYD